MSSTATARAKHVFCCCLQSVSDLRDCATALKHSVRYASSILYVSFDWVNSINNFNAFTTKWCLQSRSIAFAAISDDLSLYQNILLVLVEFVRWRPTRVCLRSKRGRRIERAVWRRQIESWVRLAAAQQSSVRLCGARIRRIRRERREVAARRAAARPSLAQWEIPIWSSRWAELSRHAEHCTHGAP